MKALRFIKHLASAMPLRHAARPAYVLLFAFVASIVFLVSSPQKICAQTSPNAQAMKAKQKQLSQEGQARSRIAGKRVRTRIKEVRDPKKAFNQDFNRIPNAPKAKYLYIQP